MPGTTLYNTDEMELWTGDMDKAGEAFESEVASLYNLIGSFLADDFTGDVSASLNDEVLQKRPYYENMRETIDAASQEVRKHAQTYTDNAERLKASIQNRTEF